MTPRIIEEVRSIATTETLLVALDFDGTVSELADDPMSVRAIPEATAVLDALSRMDDTYVAFVSGRSLRDLQIITERPPVSPILLAGSHGAEYLLPAALAEGEQEPLEEPADAAQLRERAIDAVADLAGVRIEDKSAGFALHTRLAAPAVAHEAGRRIDALMADAGWRRRDGHDVIEYAWRDEGKDDAVAHLRELTGATAVLFAGDDVTDEDALRSLGPDDLGIRVGDGETSARLSVSDPTELAVVLNVIASIRAHREV
jgi:trehalose 6-phosphate phosphatase